MIDSLDMHSLFSELEQVPVQTRCEIPLLGHIDSSINTDTIPTGHSLELPLFLVAALKQLNAVTISCPKFISREFCEDIKADSTVLDLHSKSSVFFNAALFATDFISKSERDIKQEIPRLLEKSFIERFQTLVRRCPAGSSAVRPLTEVERRMLRVGLDAKTRVRQFSRCRSTGQATKLRFKRASQPMVY
eukprot:gnl/Dysnectes_brevis/3846_a4964_803.p1 GENE.gnl/Dysnectes_brevis/3846_a4964_803~~gnl/Dysnectes_brevis/3846_a4964_803.p1  ORF type:complete len:207 (-),score=23.98 gnl/Dysnectes_brevis/3846_a4964_803:227-796(-)